MSQDLVFIAGNFGESTYIYVANLLLPVKKNKKKKSENFNTTIWSNNHNHLCDQLPSEHKMNKDTSQEVGVSTGVSFRVENVLIHTNVKLM